MLAAAIALAEAPATGMIRMPSQAILTYTVQQSENAHWSTEPTLEVVAATKASHTEAGTSRP